MDGVITVADKFTPIR